MMKRLAELRRTIQGRLIWKLMTSYLIVILVGLITFTIVTEAAIPTAFQRHMDFMATMLHHHGSSQDMSLLQDDLFDNFRVAITEALLIAMGVALASAVIVSIFVSRRVVIPIHQMTQASQRIAAGRYQERVDAISQDELGQLATSFNQMATTLEQTETRRRNLLADVAHELRTPLTSIKGYMEGLMDGVLPAEPETFQQVYREADRLQRLVNDLRELSRVETGAYQLSFAPLSIVELVKQISARLQPQFEEKHIRLELDLPTKLPMVMADEDRLSQVLVNLMGNALQYTPAGGQVTVTVETTAELSPPYVRVIIQDTGIGIPAEHLPHLFSRFYRVDKSRSRAGGGSGIGLTITSHLVEAHHGCVWAESEGLGQGSTFGFTLPMAG